jgi:hypothetical protein
VPIITAVIASIVGPTYYYYFLTTKPTDEPTSPQSPESTPSPPPQSTPSDADITVGTDKESYTIGEIVTISGNVSKPESGKSLRIDVYDPRGGILWFANGEKVDPNERGFYTYDLNTEIATIRDMSSGGELEPGKYEVLVSYLNQSAKDTFDLE